MTLCALSKGIRLCTVAGTSSKGHQKDKLKYYKTVTAGLVCVCVCVYVCVM
jgi:hypothetical protein